MSLAQKTFFVNLFLLGWNINDLFQFRKISSRGDSFDKIGWVG
jgi:hypothetical protein